MFKLYGDEDVEINFMTDKEIQTSTRYKKINRNIFITSKCPLCGNKGLEFTAEHCSMEIFKDRIMFYGEGCGAIQINFCPFCGRALYDQ